MGFTLGNAGINFDMTQSIDDAVESGIFSAKQAAKLKAEQASKLGGSAVKTAGSKAAGIAGVIGGQIAASDAQGTSTSAQGLGGAGQGAAAGFSIGGPWGAAIGGVVGGIQGALGASAARKEQNRKVEGKRITDIASIQSNATTARNATVENLISNLSRTLVR